MRIANYVFNKMGKKLSFEEMTNLSRHRRSVSKLIYVWYSKTRRGINISVSLSFTDFIFWILKLLLVFVIIVETVLVIVSASILTNDVICTQTSFMSWWWVSSKIVDESSSLCSHKLIVVFSRFSSTFWVIDWSKY